MRARLAQATVRVLPLGNGARQLSGFYQSYHLNARSPSRPRLVANAAIGTWSTMTQMLPVCRAPDRHVCSYCRGPKGPDPATRCCPRRGRATTQPHPPLANVLMARLREGRAITFAPPPRSTPTPSRACRADPIPSQPPIPPPAQLTHQSKPDAAPSTPTMTLEADRRHAESRTPSERLKYGVGLNHLPSGRRFPPTAPGWTPVHLGNAPATPLAFEPTRRCRLTGDKMRIPRC